MYIALFVDACNPLNPMDVLISWYLNTMFNEWTLTFFRTGLYNYAPVGTPAIRYTNPKAVKVRSTTRM
jgi:hypothetical protein